MVKTLTKYGNSYALVIPKAILDLLKVTESTKFEIETDGVNLFLLNANSKSDRLQKFEKARESVLNRYSSVFKNLANK